MVTLMVPAKVEKKKKRAEEASGHQGESSPALWAWPGASPLLLMALNGQKGKKQSPIPAVAT